MYLLATAIGVWAASVALVPTPWIALALASAVPLVALLWWTLAHPNRWIGAFLGAALLLPPLPLLAVGNTGPHPALLLAAAGLWAGILRLRDWTFRFDAVSCALLAFLTLLLLSIAPAIVYAGPQVAAGSLARVLLLAISAYIYLYVVQGPGASVPVSSRRASRLILWAALLTGAFACLDFYFQFPAPAGYGAQFVWLETSMLRRAQGLFYEASTLGNLCAFFLVWIAVQATASRESGHAVSRWFLLVTGGVVSAALIFSYSRASIAAVAVGLVTLALLRAKNQRSSRSASRWVLLAALVLAGTAAVYFAFPRFAESYWMRLHASAGYFLEEPNRVLSGRLTNWSAAFELLQNYPSYLLTGAGYRTLAYSDLASTGAPLIVDNMYLSLLVETGLPGLAIFLGLNAAILRTAYRAPNLFGTAIFCFWTGELVQMLSGDLFTYWRVLPLYFWVLAQAVRHSFYARPVR